MKLLKKNQTTLADAKGLPLVKRVRRALSSRRAKYGSVAVVFTLVVLAAALLFNLLLSGISDNYPLTVDLSSSDVFTLSDASRALVNEALPEGHETVQIRFMMPEDRLESSARGQMTLECARSYAEEFDGIEIDFIDPVANPSDVAKYRELGIEINSTLVVVDCPAKDRIKTFGIESCFLQKEDQTTDYGFDGETQFTAALMAVSRTVTPVVTFTMGHGESVPPRLERMFTTAGYKVEYTDLMKSELNPATEIVIISDPHSDFFGSRAGEKNEISILRDYLESFRDVMVFLSPDTPALPELDALLELYGISVLHGEVLRADGTGFAGNEDILFADFGGESYLNEGTYTSRGAALHKTASQITEDRAAPLNVIVPHAAPLKLLLDSSADEGRRSVDSVLVTSPEAYVSGKEEEKGTFAVMALSTTEDVVDDAYMYSYVLVCSSADFFDESVPITGGNSQIIYSAMTLMGRESAPQGIELKRLDDTTLTVTQEYAKTALIVTMTVIPGVVFLIGMRVYFKRKHK